jgi:nicotinamide-nucleotide amidase
MEEIVGKLLREAKQTVAVAESLTAGMVCSRIANVPGSSDYLLGGVVSYTIEAKREILGVPRELLSECAVNKEVAEAMATSVKTMFGADLGLATTGVAGPGTGGEVKPPGTACVALAHEGGVISLERRLPGYRQMVRDITCMAALNMVRLHLLQDKWR